MFDALEPKPADPLLAIIGMFAADDRESKIDLGVGVYKDPAGITPVMASVKAAERQLLEEQTSKSYVGLVGDVEYVALMQRLAFGAAGVQRQDRTVGLQTTGGSAALRLGADLIHASRPDATVWLGDPSWDNHAPILDAVGCPTVHYEYFNVAQQTLQFDTMMDALGRAKAGDVVLLQGCCHNPTGSDLSTKQWLAVADLCCAQGLIPFIDVAYQGLGVGLEQDLEGVNLLLEQVPEALVTLSCSKNFGLYRERTGALYVQCESAAHKAAAASNLLAIARTSYSMPPDHGASIVRTILQNEELTQQWQRELSEMQQRIAATRAQLVTALGQQHSYLVEQKGMFSTLALTPEAILGLREEHAIYMAGSGRINVAGFRGDEIERFASVVGELIDR